MSALRGQRERRREPVIDRRCAECGEIFDVAWKSAGRQRFCTDACRIEHHAAKRRTGRPVGRPRKDAQR